MKRETWVRALRILRRAYWAVMILGPISLFANFYVYQRGDATTAWFFAGLVFLPCAIIILWITGEIQRGEDLIRKSKMY